MQTKSNKNKHKLDFDDEVFRMRVSFRFLSSHRIYQFNMNRI